MKSWNLKNFSKIKSKTKLNTQKTKYEPSKKHLPNSFVVPFVYTLA